jgi:hypothetical protein
MIHPEGGEREQLLAKLLYRTYIFIVAAGSISETSQGISALRSRHEGHYVSGLTDQYPFPNKKAGLTCLSGIIAGLNYLRVR